MTRFLSTIVALSLMAQSHAHAQTPTTQQITLDDGTILIGKINQNIEVQTKFGKLTLPFEDVISAHLGYNLTEEETKEVAKAFKDLDSSTYKERENAQLYLKTIGERAFILMPKSYGGTPAKEPKELDPKEKHPALEQQRRIEQWIKATRPDPKYLHDYINTDESTIKGKIITKQITIQHAILGDLKVDIARIKGINSHSNVETTVKTDSDWKEVLSIHGSNKVVITATGQIDLWPQGPGQYVTTPKGFTSAGKGGNFMAGALIGKLDNGQPFLVGDNCTVTQPGRLYLKIVESPWNNLSTGQYRVTIERR